LLTIDVHGLYPLLLYGKKQQQQQNKQMVGQGLELEGIGEHDGKFLTIFL